MQELSPMQTAWLRYFAAWLALLPFVFFNATRHKAQIKSIVGKVLRPQILPWLLLMGLITFFVSSYAQYRGLSQSTATANTLIVALEPIFAAFLAWIFLKESLSHREIFAFFLACFGFGLLSNLRPDEFRASLNLFNYGNLFLLIAMPAEAMYTIISRKLAHKLSALELFGYALSFGFFCFTCYVFLVRQEKFPEIHGAKMFFALFWLGPLGTTMTYIYWSKALKDAPVAFVALTLFVQPIQGALVGRFYLGETLSLWQAFGAALILGALVLQSFPHFKTRTV